MNRLRCVATMAAFFITHNLLQAQHVEEKIAPQPASQISDTESAIKWVSLSRMGCDVPDSQCDENPECDSNGNGFKVCDPCNCQCRHSNHCFKWGKDTWLKAGAGIRASYNAINATGVANRQDFAINNARLYFNGQGHPNIGFEFNTDVNNAQGFDESPFGGQAAPFGTFQNGEMRILDAILKFKVTDNIHVWTGRFLPPSDRSNLSGPFYINAWNFPYTQFGYANIFQGRDDGAAVWGQLGEGVFKWQFGAFEGENDGGPVTIGHPASDNLMMNGRLVLNLLDPEPGYYNQSTYYGEKDILALGASVMHRHDALSDPVGPGQADYTAWNLDFLYEQNLAGIGVVTLEAAYYDFNDNNGVLVSPPFAANTPVTLPPSGGPRQGESYFILGSYLLPGTYHIGCLEGAFQILGRYQEYDRDNVGGTAGGIDEQRDVQLSYIMFGHNARISAVWSQLDLLDGRNVDTFTLGTQLQF